MDKRAMVVVVALVAVMTRAGAQELNFFGGDAHDERTDKNTAQWAVEYRENTGSHTAASFIWINEGHLPRDHRDGMAVQFWGRTSPRHDRLTLSAGAGPYFWADTTLDSSGAFTGISHGLAAALSLDATWRLSRQWQCSLRGNWIEAPSGFDSSSLNLGLGYLFPGGVLPYSTCREGENCSAQREELTVFGGATIANRVPGTTGFTDALEYRRGLSHYADWTVSFLDENDSKLTRHEGVATQLWATRAFHEERWSLGAGLGAYFPLDTRAVAGSTPSKEICALVSATASYRLDPRWDVRATWSRLVANNDSDADIGLLGLGYRFGHR